MSGDLSRFFIMYGEQGSIYHKYLWPTWLAADKAVTRIICRDIADCIRNLRS